MNKLLALVSLFALFACTLAVLSNAPLTTGDAQALAAIQSEFSIDQDGWDDNVTPNCTWEGVYCDNGTTSQRVLKLDLRPGGYESGDLPSEIGQLTALKEFYIDDWGLDNEIPSSFQNLVNLEVLYIDDSFDYEFQFPQWLGLLTALRVINLPDNRFNDTVPDLHNLVDLYYLDLSDNTYLTGNFPNLPDSPDLLYIDLSDCNFDGRLPNWIDVAVDLAYVDISENEFHGVIPSEWGTLGANLTYLDFSDNSLYGHLPTSFSGLTVLRHLDLEYNYLQGNVQEILGDLQNLTYCYVDENYFICPENFDTCDCSGYSNNSLPSSVTTHFYSDVSGRSISTTGGPNPTNPTVTSTTTINPVTSTSTTVHVTSTTTVNPVTSTTTVHVTSTTTPPTTTVSTNPTTLTHSTTSGASTLALSALLVLIALFVF